MPKITMLQLTFWSQNHLPSFAKGMIKNPISINAVINSKTKQKDIYLSKHNTLNVLKSKLKRMNALEALKSFSIFGEDTRRKADLKKWISKLEELGNK